MAGAAVTTLPPVALGVRLVGDELAVPCLDGRQRRYVNLDAAASTGALPAVAERVAEFLPWYSSVHRGAGYLSQVATTAYEHAREAILSFARHAGSDDVAIICATPPRRSTTSPIACGSIPRTS
jgi:selenocysteine lyase/cysteine desulfurase